MEEILKALFVIAYWLGSPSIGSKSNSNKEDLNLWQYLVGILGTLIIVVGLGWLLYLAFFHPDLIINSWFSPFHTTRR